MVYADKTAGKSSGIYELKREISLKISEKWQSFSD